MAYVWELILRAASGLLSQPWAEVLAQGYGIAVATLSVAALCLMMGVAWRMSREIR